MILEIDVGNTRTKWRVKDRQRIVMRGLQPTESTFEAFKIDASIGERLSSAVMSSVVKPQMRDDIIYQLDRSFGIKTKMAIVSERVGPVECGYKRSCELGIDRWLAILAGFQRLAGAMIVIDAGSAITIDFVDGSGKHRGGFIAPGISMMRDSLLNGAHGVQSWSSAQDDLRGPASDTGAAVSRGCVLSAVSLINYLSKDQSSSLVLTGGDAKLLLHYLSRAPIYVEDLVLEGLSVDGVQFETI